MHVISGLLRKAPFIKSGVGQDGQSTMYAVELSEKIQGWNGAQDTYTNYKALLFAKTPKAIEFYNKSLSEGSFIVLSCDKLKVEQRDHNGQTYITLVMDNPKLDGAKYPENAQGWGQPQQPPQQQQRQAQQQSQPQYNEPPVDYSDDIPFAPIALQYRNLLNAM